MTDFDELPARTIDLLDRRAADAAHTLRAAHVAPPPFDPGRRLPPSGLGVGLMVAMVALVVAAGAMVVAANRDGEPEHRGIAGPVGSVGDLAPLVPTWLPDGVVLFDAGPTQVVDAPNDQRVTVALYGIDASADPHDGPILTVVRGRFDGQATRDWLEGATAIELGGVEAWVHESVDGSTISWIVDGVVVGLAGRWLDAVDLIDLAADLITEPASLESSESWRLLHQTETTVRELVGVRLDFRGEPPPRDPRVLFVSWHLRGHRSFDLLRAAHRGDPHCAARSLVECGVRRVEVSGQPALAWSGIVDDLGRSSVVWLDDDGRAVTVESWGLDDDEVLRVAEGLRPGSWDDLEPERFPGPDTTMTTAVEHTAPTQPGGHPGRDVDAARALVGDPRLQIRPVLDSRGERDTVWHRSPAASPPWDEPVTLLGVAVDGWYPGVHELGPAALDGSVLVDAYPLPAPSNAFSVRGDRLWLQFGPDADGALDQLADACTTASAACPAGAIAIVWEDEVVAVLQMDGPVRSRALTIRLGSWDRNRLVG